MHPGPMLRGMEISFDVADRPNAVVLGQVANGVYTRMATLFTLLGSSSAQVNPESVELKER